MRALVWSARRLLVNPLHALLLLLVFALGLGSLLFGAAAATSVGRLLEGYGPDRQVLDVSVIVDPGSARTTFSDFLALQEALGSTAQFFASTGTKAVISYELRSEKGYLLANFPAGRDRRQYELQSGRWLSASEETKAELVCVLSRTLAARLGLPEAPEGKRVLVDGLPLVIVGTWKNSPRMALAGVRQEGMSMFLPFSTLQKRFSKKDAVSISYIVSRSQPAERRQAVEAAVTRLLRSRRGLSSGTANDFVLWNADQHFRIIEKAVRPFRTQCLLASVGLFCLALAGAVILTLQIANSQRPAVGILRAVGANRRRLRVEFLVSAICLLFASIPLSLLLQRGLIAVLKYALASSNPDYSVDYRTFLAPYIPPVVLVSLILLWVGIVLLALESAVGRVIGLKIPQLLRT